MTNPLIGQQQNIKKNIFEHILSIPPSKNLILCVVFNIFMKKLTKKLKNYIFYTFSRFAMKKVYAPRVPGVTTIQKLYLCTMWFLKNIFISMYNCVLIHKKGLKNPPKVNFYIYILV